MWILSLVYYFTIGFAILTLFRWYLRLVWGSIHISNEVSARGKVVVITGASAGIGKAAAKEFAERDAIVILACRDLNKAQRTVDWIRTCTGMGELICMKLDLASLESVRSFCKEFQSKYDRLDILVNNAGLLVDPEKKKRTDDGFEIHMGVNHLGHFLLTNLLMEQIKKGSSSRIVNVSSMGHSWNTLDLDDIMSDIQSLQQIKASSSVLANALYCKSKMANALFNKELAKRLEGSGVNTYALCPGMVVTDIGQQDMTGLAVKLMMLFMPIFAYLMKSAKEGADTVMYCALSKDLITSSGEMYQNCGYWDPKDRAVLMDEDAKKLWAVSEKLVGL